MKRAILDGEARLEIPFQDVDSMDVVWHGNYFRYFEAARSQLLRKIDYDYDAMRATGYLWPIIDTQVRYVQPIRYRQEILVYAQLVEWENRLRIEYVVRDAAKGTRLTKGYTIQCAVDTRTGELQLVSPTPLLERLAPFLEKS